MKRCALKLLLFLLAGAIINVAVAWACVLWSPTRTNNGVILLGDRFGATDHFETWPKLANGEPPAFGKLVYLKTTAGLPLRALTFGRNGWGPTRRLILNQPLFPGFAINTIFYAAVLWGGLWVVFAVPVKLRKRRRIKRGQCASCGYSLRGTPHVEKCPECGIAIRRAR
jgi:hypothetical protein